MAEMVQETKRKTKYKQYAVLRISARLTFKLRYAKEIHKVELLLERKKKGRVIEVFVFSYLQFLEIIALADHIFECRQKWRSYSKTHLLSNLWISYSDRNNMVSFTEYEYSYINEVNVLVKRFSINFYEFEQLYSFHDIIMTQLPMLKDVERCCFSHHAQNQLVALTCFHCNPIQDSFLF